MDIYCPNCRKRFARNDDFCSKCGKERNWGDEDYDDDYDEDSDSAIDYPYTSKYFGKRYRVIPCRECWGTGRGSLFFNKCKDCGGGGEIADYED